MIQNYKVTGMSCAACSARVEKAVRGLAGVSDCAVNLLTGDLRVEGEITADTVIRSVVAAGYGCTAKGEKTPTAMPQEKDDAAADFKKRLFSSLFFLVLLMYLSMGHMIGLPLPPLFHGNIAARGVAELLLSGILLVINRRFFINGAKGVWHRAPNMDTLVSLGAGVSYLWSVYVLFAVIDAMGRGDAERLLSLSHAYYFESAGMILTLITVGKWLEARAKGKTTDAIRSLLALAPEEASVLRDGKEVRLPVSQVLVGDTVVLRPGERVPVDGTVLDGEGAFDESALTGESIPVDKKEGDRLYAASVGLSGTLRFRATGVGEDTALGRIIETVKEASATKAPIAKLADRVSGIFVPAVLLISLATFALWMFLGETFAKALEHAIAVLVISCPCALGLATPVAVMVGSGMGAKNGILFKTAASLEETGRASIVVLDKTGTVTEGKPRVTDVLPAPNISEAELLSLAYALERGSEHPLGRAVVTHAEEKGISALPVTAFRAHAGNGVSATSETGECRGGKRDFVNVSLPNEMEKAAERLSEEGKTPLWFSQNGSFYGMIAVADTVKEDSAAAIAWLKRMKIEPVMLTGDNEKTAKAIAEKVGIREVRAGVLPEEKAAFVLEKRKTGKVIMVGDGINDAPALASADIGIAIGAGTDIAIDSADVVLVRSTLGDVPSAIALSRATLRHVKQNLFWAFFYNVIGIPIAAGALVPLGFSLSPMIGAAAMSLSSVTVVSNALRLRFAKIYENVNKNIQNKGENQTMKVTIKIQGMMCPHCSGRVKEALSALPFVTNADVSHESGEAIVTVTEGADKSLLQKTVEDAGYRVLSI